jgi:DnaK suppressor protein
MQPAEKIKLQDLISQELVIIDSHIAELEVRCQPVSPDNAIGRLSRMEAIGERGVHQTALAAATQRRQALQTALQRIREDEGFGLCERCDEPILLARLMLMPESRFCVRCLQSDG